VGEVPPQIVNDRRIYAFEVRQHFIVPKPQNPVAFALQEAAPFGFLRRRRVVLTTIDFDD
jgi:hypothetical protein